VITGRESWVPDELTTAGRENLDPAHVARYDTKMDAEAASESAWLSQLCGVPTATVVDLGAGTGQFTLEAASWAGRVVAVDVSPVMLDRLRSKLETSTVKNVECVAAGFLTYQHEGAPADVVYSRFALHHLPDFWKAVALTRIASFLRAGGLFRLWDAVYSFDSPDAATALERWFSGSAGKAIAEEWLRDELEEHVRDEHSTFTWLLEPIVVRAGFDIEHAEYSEDRVFARYLCRRSGTQPG
jgi:ubiquinone/menaquinone biosynthesis C-methylase UbiE